MKIVQVVIDERTLSRIDREARRKKVNRSALIRTALGHYLAHRQEADLEERHRRGYERHPVAPGELDVWDQVLSWPEG